MLDRHDFARNGDSHLAARPVPGAREADRLLYAALQATRAVLGAWQCAFIASEPRSELSDRATDDAFLARARAQASSDASMATAHASADAEAIRCQAVRAGPVTYGTLVALWADGSACTEVSPLLDALARHLGHLLAHTDSTQPTNHAYEALSQIATRLHGQAGDLDAVLELIVDQATGLLGTDLAWLALVEDDRPTLATAVIRGFRDLSFLDLHLALGKGVGGVAVSEHRAIIIGDYRADAHDTPADVRQAAEAEGIVSMICAPMFKDEVMVGALYVANHETTAFTDVDATLLSALAAQASVAIQNRRLYGRLSEQNDLLEQAFLIHRELTQASLEGVGLAGIGEVLAHLIGHPIVITQNVCDPAVLRCPATSADETSQPSIARAIVADGRHLGSVEMLGARELSPLQRKALEHGITVLALELVKQRIALEVEWRLSGELLDELLERAGSMSEALTQRARRLGVDVTTPRRMLALAVDGDHAMNQGNLLAIVRETTRRHGPQSAAGSLSVKRGDRVLLALGPALEADAVSIAHDIQQAARIHGVVVRVGIGPLRKDLRESFRSAIACLALASSSGTPDAVVEFDLLGPLRFLLDAANLQHASAMIGETLAPVQAYDAASRTPLLPTLRAFVECDGHYARTAQQLYIAVSTLKYRLRKLQQLLGRSTSDPDLRFQLRLAFNLLDVVEAIGGEDSAPRAGAEDIAAPQAGADVLPSQTGADVLPSQTGGL